MSLLIDHKLFFDGYRQRFGPISEEENRLAGVVANLDQQLGFVADDPLTTDPREFAYMLGTEVVETRRPFETSTGRRWLTTFGPVREYGSDAYLKRMYDPASPDPHRAAMARANGNTTPGDGLRYCGQGYVQLTWRNNYARLSQVLRDNYQMDVDLVAHPELARDPLTAYRIMSAGMHKGLFTGKRLGLYVRDGLTDYVGARRVINPGEFRTAEGRQVVQRIAEAATSFEWIIRQALQATPQTSGWIS